MIVYALGACHAECPWCARDFWRWLKNRIANMSRVVDGVSFAVEAAKRSPSDAPPDDAPNPSPRRAK